MSQTSLARNYARAIFAIAVEKNQIDEWSKTLENFHMLFMNNDMINLSQDPRLSKEQFFQILKDNFCKDLSDENVHFLYLIVMKRRGILLPIIYDWYHNLQTKHEKILKVNVKSARVLTKQQKQRLESALAKAFQIKLIFIYQLNSGLMGGIMLQIGDFVIDATIRNMWQKLSMKLHIDI